MDIKKQARILIIDNNRDFVESLRNSMEAEGFFTLTAINAGDALDVCKKKNFDIAIIDSSLPDRTGDELLSELRAVNQDIKGIIIAESATLKDAVSLVGKEGLISYENKPVDVGGIVAVIRKCFSRKVAENMLQESEERFRVTLMSIGDAVITTDHEGKIRILNAEAESLTGWQMDEAAGRPLEEVFKIINEDTLLPVENPVRRVVREGVVVGLANHTSLVRRNGDDIPIADSGAPIRDAKGNITGVVLVFRDQTKERAAQKKLRESEERFRSLAELSPFPISIIGASGKYDYLNPVFTDVFGYTLDDIPDGREWFRQAFPDEPYRKEVIEVWKEDLRKTKPGEVRLREFQVTCKNHEIKDVLFRSVTPDGSKQFITYEDITERIRDEKEIREQRDTAQNYLNIAGVMFVALNADGIVKLINRKGCEILGCRKHEILGKNWIENFVPQNRRKEVASVFQQLISGEIELVEYVENTVITKSGEERIIAWHNALLKDGVGKLAGTLSSGEDITERRQAEEALRESEQQLRALSQKIITMQENERARLSRELHDQIGKALVGLSLEIGWIKIQEKPTVQSLDILHEKVLCATSEVRRICKGLRPMLLDDLGLTTALQNLMNEYKERELFEVQSSLTSIEANEISPESSICIYRVAQEALTNAGKHSGADIININMRKKDDNIVLIIGDNGSGFSLKKKENIHGLGLLGMKERALLCGGSLEFVSEVGKGTVIILTVPLRQ